MVTLKGLVRTFTTAKNPPNVLLLKFSKSAKSVTFRNGSTFQLTWSQFRILRDNYALIREYVVDQVDNDMFKIKNKKFEIIIASSRMQLIPSIFEAMQEYVVEQVENDIFKIKSKKFELIGSPLMLLLVRELERGEYNCDLRNKVVLDVGGFQGESAVFFSGMGAKKVIIYEPVVTHHKFIKENIALNHVNAEIHVEGIGDKNGIITVSYGEADWSFSLTGKGNHTMEIKIRNVAEVIAESRADVAKFDCEGAEESLVRVPTETLRRTDSYMIETHGTEIKKMLIKKFEDSGFELVKETVNDPQHSVIFLKKKCDT